MLRRLAPSPERTFRNFKGPERKPRSFLFVLRLLAQNRKLLVGQDDVERGEVLAHVRVRQRPGYRQDEWRPLQQPSERDLRARSLMRVGNCAQLGMFSVQRVERHED